MKTNSHTMLHLEFYSSIMQSFLDNPIMKALIAALVSLFAIPIEFMVALPVFWCLDFISGLFAAKKQGKSFSIDKLNSQYVKMGIHIAFITGCVVLSNLFSVQEFLTFGFGYIIATEFISTIRNLFGDKKSAALISHFREMLLSAIGLKLPDDKK